MSPEGFAVAAQLFGFVGVVLYLGAYALLQLGFVRGQSYLYAGLNMAAATCVLISLAETFNLSSAIIQVSFILLSALGMIRLYLLSQRLRFSREEAQFRESKLPALTKLMARTLFDHGAWTEGAPGVELTTEGAPASQLVYIVRGKADVIVDGRAVASVGPGSLIGELTVLNREPATATVRVAEPARYFAIKADRLRRLVTSDGELRTALEASFSGEARRKLMAVNAANKARLDAAEAAGGPGSVTAVTPFTPKAQAAE